MRHKILWVGFIAALVMALVAGDGGLAQPPGGKKKGDFGGKGGKKGGSVTVDQIVERIMAFDKNNDGKITKDELPERMQHLIALGDTNKDGALDKQEVQALAEALESLVGLFNAGGPGFGGKGGGPKGAKGPDLLRVLDDLDLTGATKEKATALVKEHQDKVRKLQADLLVQMKDVLPDEDYKSFKVALDKKGPPPFGGPQADLQRKLDQLQQDLDELRRDLKKK
jgi:hypothetical protein